MAIEDLTAYTAGGSESANITEITPARATFAEIESRDDTWLYFDFGEGYWNDDIDCTFAIHFTGMEANAVLWVWVMANVIGSKYDLQSGDNNWQFVQIDGTGISTFNIRCGDQQNNSASSQGDTIALSTNTTYYCRIVRDYDAGSNGSLTLFVYSDETMETLVGTSSCYLNIEVDARYFYPIQSFGYGSLTNDSDGYVENYNFGLGGGLSIPVNVTFPDRAIVASFPDRAITASFPDRAIDVTVRRGIWEN